MDAAFPLLRVTQSRALLSFFNGLIDLAACKNIEEYSKGVPVVQDLISQLAFVKDIHPEHRVKRSLVWAEEECEKHSGSLCDVGPHQHINKRPGR